MSLLFAKLNCIALGLLCVALLVLLCSGCGAITAFVTDFSGEANGHDPQLRFCWVVSTGLVISLENVDGSGEVLAHDPEPGRETTQAPD